MDNLDQLSSLLAPILNDPDAMAGIAEAAAQLGLGGMLSDSLQQSRPDEPDSPDKRQEPEENRNTAEQSSGNTGNAGDIFSRLLPLISGSGNQSDTSRLLSALRPFLHGERARRLDDAEKLIKLLGTVNTLRQQGLL